MLYFTLSNILESWDNMAYSLISIIFMLLTVSLLGYFFVVIKEKINLKNNTIVIDRKSVSKDYIDETDMKVFILGGEEIKSGDELKFVLHNNKKITGIIIGAKKKEKIIYVATYKNGVEILKINKIKTFKIISRYGKFFKTI